MIYMMIMDTRNRLFGQSRFNRNIVGPIEVIAEYHGDEGA